jgi:hypothetical protein
VYGWTREGEYDKKNEKRSEDEEKDLAKPHPSHPILLKRLEKGNVAKRDRYRATPAEQVDGQGDQGSQEAV